MARSVHPVLRATETCAVHIKSRGKPTSGADLAFPRQLAVAADGKRTSAAYPGVVGAIAQVVPVQ